VFRAEPKLQSRGRNEPASPLAGWFRLGLITQLLFGGLMIWIGVGSAPLWFDELASIAVAGRSVGGVFDLIANTDANMGLYYLLLHGWLLIDDSEAFVRALSAIPALAAVPVTAILARRLFGDMVGLVAGFLLAGSMFAIVNAQNARGYSLAMLLIVLAVMFFVEAALGRRPWAWVLCGASFTLSIYASPLSGLVLVAAFASLPFLPRPREVLRPAVTTLAVTGFAVAPLALLMLRAGGSQVNHLSRPGVADAIQAAGNLIAMGNVALIALWSTLIGAALLALWRRTPEVQPGMSETWRWRRLLIVGWAVIPAALLFTYSQIDPLFKDRYLITSVPALAILAAIGLVAIARRHRVLGVTAGLAMICLTVLARVDLESYGESLTPGWGEGNLTAARIIATRGRPGDGILYLPNRRRLGIVEQLEREAPSEAILPDDFSVAADPEETGDLYGRQAPQRIIKRRLEKHRRVWLLRWHGRIDRHPIGAGLSPLLSRYRPILRQELGSGTLELYRRSGPHRNEPTLTYRQVSRPAVSETSAKLVPPLPFE
jgi:mannosyltransferase